jgi:3-hydroxyisobutyrate dehydrogenase-like beta-hydroxyacid dehydrogenase
MGTTIGWIGLGKLGLPMAACLARAGHAVRGYDPDPRRLALARDHGIGVAPDLRAAAAGAGLVFASLPDDAVLEAALLGPDGLVAGLAKGTVLAETSTVAPRTSARVAEAAAARDVAYLRLPISGSTALAESGQVTCFASGPRDAFERVRPVLAAFTRAQTWLGEAEQARYAKLAINLMIAVSAGMMAEALTLARRGGIDWRQMLEAMGESAVASPFVKYKLGPLAARDFAPAFTARQIVKDLDLILEASGEAGVPTPLAEVLRRSYDAVLAAGAGEDDFIAIVRQVERAAGLGEPA